MFTLYDYYKSIFTTGSFASFKAQFGFSHDILQYIYDQYVNGVIKYKWFLIVMEYLACYPKSYVHPVYWRISRSSYTQNLWPTVKLLEELLPSFNPDDRYDETSPSPIFKRIRCIVDATEIRIQNPGGKKRKNETKKQRRMRWYRQKTYYSFKKRMHCVKYQVIVTVRSGKIVDVSEMFPGKVHDKRMWDIWRIKSSFDLDLREKAMADKGYIGIPECLTPFKKQPNRELDEVENSFNKELGSVRVLVEQVIGRIKKFQILRQTFRSALWKHPTVFRLCAKLTNLSFKFQPIRK